MTAPSPLTDWPSPFRSVAVPTSAVGEAFAVAGQCLIGGWSFRETTGLGPAEMELWDGGPQGGDSIAVITLAAGQSMSQCAPVPGIEILSRLFISITAGSIRGAVWAVIE